MSNDKRDVIRTNSYLLQRCIITAYEGGLSIGNNTHVTLSFFNSLVPTYSHDVQTVLITDERIPFVNGVLHQAGFSHVIRCFDGITCASAELGGFSFAAPDDRSTDFFGSNFDGTGTVNIPSLKKNAANPTYQRAELLSRIERCDRKLSGAFLYAGSGLYVYGNGHEDALKLSDYIYARCAASVIRLSVNHETSAQHYNALT